MFENEKTNLKIVGVIPARYASTRFPGKPLADICGKPMIWWVYEEFSKINDLSEIYIATDDIRIEKECKKYGINVVMTSDKHPTHLDRLGEFAQKVNADFYININGDEPLVKSENIEKIIPIQVDPNEFYIANAMTTISNPTEVVDFSRIKIAVDMNGYAMYMARSPIPYPKSSSDFQYNKFVGIQCFSKSALQFCSITKRGVIESIEDIDEYRFLENGKKIKMISVNTDSLSVDMPKDLEKIRSIIRRKINSGEITI